LRIASCASVASLASVARLVLCALWMSFALLAAPAFAQAQTQTPTQKPTQNPPQAQTQSRVHADPQPYVVFDRAEFVQSNSLTPPVDAKWEPVSLPDSWRQQKRPRGVLGWYRIKFMHAGGAHHDAESGQRAIYITRITNNIEMFLNGSSFAVSGRFGADPEESWNLAQFHFVPPSLMREGENELLIRLHTDSYARAGISAVHLGNSAALRPLFNQRYFVQTKLPQLITGVLIVTGIFSFTIWLRRRNETLLLLFSLMAAVAVVRLFHHYLRDTPVWLAAAAVPAMCWLTAFQVAYALHYAKRPIPRVEHGLYWFAGACTVMLVVAAWVGHYYTATGIVYLSLTVLNPILASIIIYQLTRNLTRGNVLMIFATLGTSVFGLHDFLNYQEYLGYDRLYLIPLGLPLLLLAVAALLARRFVDTLRDYETLNTDLATRIASRERDLAASFARERMLDQQRATSEERQRLMRDMHDGLGSHLMSTLALTRRGNLTQQDLETVLADCIDELKLTIDSLEPIERDLLVVLGNLRYRLEPRLNAAGISLEWAISDLPPLDYLDPENVRSILRIVQEAFTNTLKHANATRITLSTGVDRASNRVWVRVTDDGTSIDLSKVQGGRGLSNMRTRATRLHGAVEVLALKGGGTCVNLYLPLQ
jgi:signal transduction histidine kinase